MHGDLSQNQRDLVMKSFRARQIQMLVATDVAARGIDVDDITHVIHYQLPDEIETYTHRSGRTGRAGKSGVSMVIVPKSEVKKIKAIEKIIQQPFELKKLPNGMEICEIQLYHLANNIKNIDADKAIEDYLPAIYDVLQGLNREELIKKMVAVEFNRFFNYYKNSADLNISEGKNSNSISDGNEVRFFINIGERDGYDWKTLKDFLKATLDLGRDDIFKVDVKNSFSFFNTDSEHSDLVMDTFNNFQLDGRFVNVEISSKQEGKSSRKGGKKEKNKEVKGNRKSAERSSQRENNSSKKSKNKGREQKTSQAFEKAFGKRKRRK